MYLYYWNNLALPENFTTQSQSIIFTTSNTK